MMLLEKYRPQSSKEIIGNYYQINQIKEWLKRWNKKNLRSALMVLGPSGCGKSISVETACKESGYEPVFYHSADMMDAKAVVQQSKQKSIFGKKKALVFEDAKVSASLIEQSGSPVIIITWEDMHKLRKMCDIVKFTKIRHDTIANFLKTICKKEGLKADDLLINQIAKMSDGDVRAALIDMEMGAGSIREKTDRIFETLRLLFRTMSIENALIAMEKCDTDDIDMWLQENVAEQYSLEETAKAYEYLAKADLFSARIMRRNAWSLDKYRRNISVFGTVLSKNKINNKFSMYKTPFYRKQQMPLQKVASHVHASQRKAAGYMPLLKQIMKGRTDSRLLVQQLKLEEEEVEALVA